jgi:hypothetical protein
MIMVSSAEDLQSLVHRQVEIILHHDTTVRFSAVMAAVAQNIGEAPDRDAVKTILDSHPGLVPVNTSPSEVAVYERRLDIPNEKQSG